MSFEGNVELFRISLKIEVRLDSEKNIYVAATALSNRQSLSVASMIPALRDNEVRAYFRFFGSYFLSCQISIRERVHCCSIWMFLYMLTLFSSMIVYLFWQILKSFAIEEVKLTLNKTKSGTTFSIEGSATLFKIPVSASLLMGTGGRLELKIFTPAGRSVPLSTIIPSVSNVPVREFLVVDWREDS